MEAHMPSTPATASAKAKPKAARPAKDRSAKEDIDAASKNRPLVEDIRLLGRMLGDVIREQEGVDAFELIEGVRKLSVAYRLKADTSAGRVLDRLLNNLSTDQTVSVIRAFSYFSHLANIAEDRHHVRRRAVHDKAGRLQEGSLALALEAARAGASIIRAHDVRETVQALAVQAAVTAAAGRI